MSQKEELITLLEQVFDNKIATLSQVKESVKTGFVKAVDVLFATKGKVVVSGIGKSGLIGKKIAATMTSTGTLAIFLHPAEALHGDLGVINSDDVVLAIGKSGESDELISMLPAIKEIGAKVISITSNTESTLAKESDVVLYAKIDREADLLNLAPTSSTTAALVIGDALAVALMKLHDFKEERFALYHPGGRLGRRLLLKVKDIMRSGEQNPIIDENESVKSLLYQITQKRSGAISVVNKQGNLRGLVTDYDIRTILETDKDLYSLSIAEIMNSDPIFVYESAKAVEALDIMENRDKPLLVLPVLSKESEKVTGMIHLHDLLSYRI